MLKWIFNLMLSFALAYLVMIYTYVQGINSFERCCTQHRNESMIRIGRRVNHPQSIIIHGEINHIEFGRVQIVGVVGTRKVELPHT